MLLVSLQPFGLWDGQILQNPEMFPDQKRSSSGRAVASTNTDGLSHALGSCFVRTADLCLFVFILKFSTNLQVLESFKIMDYSLLLGVHNIDQQERERQSEGAHSTSDEKRPVGQKALYSTAMESIQGGAARGESIDTDDT